MRHLNTPAVAYSVAARNQVLLSLAIFVTAFVFN